MKEYYEDTADVVVLVLRNQADDADYYLIARDRTNDFWEFPGGKIKKDEPLEHAIFRELDDEIRIDWSEEDIDIVREGDELESPENQVYNLKPVLVDIDSEVAWELGPEDLSEEHTDLKWITLGELDDHETIGEHEILEALDLL